MAKYIEGDILDAKEDVIIHQCNCVTEKAKGLALSIFEKWPETNVYKKRNKARITDTPGTVTMCEIGETGRFVANLFAQRYPGKARFNNDTAKLRLKWFSKGLNEIVVGRPFVESVALPHRIGCGLAGGEWGEYEKIVDEFAEKNIDVKVVVYKK